MEAGGRTGSNPRFAPQEFEYMLEMGEKSKLKEKMIPLVSQFQQSGNNQDSTNKKQQDNSNAASNEGGRPQMDDSELSDSGEQAREDETNANRRGM